MAFMKYGEDQRSQTSLNRTREHARQLAQRMSDDSSRSPQHSLPGSRNAAGKGNFDDFAAFGSLPQNSRRDGDNDSTFHSQASSFFDEDPFGNDLPAAQPVGRKQRKDDSLVADWPSDFESPKSMSTMPSNSSMQSAYAKQLQHEQYQAPHPSTPTQKSPRVQQHSLTQPRMPETPEIRPSASTSSSTGAAARRRMRQQQRMGADLTPPQSPHSLKRYASGEGSSLGSSQKNRLGDHVQSYSSRSRTGSNSNRSVSGKSVASSASGTSDIFDHRSNVGAGFTFDAFGLDASQINAQVDEAMQDLVGTHPDFSFFQQDTDDDFANGKWNQQASPAPSRASTPPIAEEGQDGFVDGFRVTKAKTLPVHIRPQYSPSPSERSSLTSESNQDDGRVNLFKEKAAFASSRPRMIVRPSGPPSHPNLDVDDLSVDRRGRVPPMPDCGQQVEFVGEDSETPFPQSRSPQRYYQLTAAAPPNSDTGVRSDVGVASDTGVQSGAESDAAVQSDHGRNTSRGSMLRGTLPAEVLSKKKSSTDTATTAETNGTYQIPFEEKKEEGTERTENRAPAAVRSVMTQWQQRDHLSNTHTKNHVSSPNADNQFRSGSSPARMATPEAPTLTRQSLERYQSDLDNQTPPLNRDYRSPEKKWPDAQSSPANNGRPAYHPARSEGGAALRSSHVHSVMERIQAQDTKNGDDAKSDAAGASPYQVKLRRTGMLNRPAEDDADQPVSPLTQRNTPRHDDYQAGRPPQVSVSEEGLRSGASPPTRSRAMPPAEEPKKMSYRERRELELQRQREEEQRKEEEQKPPDKDVASLIRKRVAANKKAPSPSNAANNNEAQDRLGSLRPTTAPYSRSTSNTSNEYSVDTPAKTNSDRDYNRQSESMDSTASNDLSIESTGSLGVFEKLEQQPSAAVSHLRQLEQLQSLKDKSDNDVSPEARHRLLVSVGSGDAEEHKKSSTPKATKMMLNAFLAGRSSIGEGGEDSAADPSNGKESSSATGGFPALKDDPKYQKYFKMLKMGMPVEVVKHAMVRDGEDPDLMDQDPSKPAGIPLKDDPTYQKYFKMLRVGMPMDAVKHAMIRDGLDCSVMDHDHNLPVCKMVKEEDDEPKEKDSRRRARLHWKTLRKVTSNSLWAKIDQEVDMEQIEIDEQEFKELFQAEHDEVKPTKSAVATPAKGVTVRVIDPKRANNGGIILARLKMSHDDMADAVDRINEHALNAEQIEHIIEYLPSKEERKALEAYMLEGGQDAAEKFEGLCECEKFMVSMMTVKHAKRKVRALLFKLQFEKCLDDILKDTLAIEAACDNLTHSVRLRQLLGIILNFGNRLNTAGNKRRKAGAFTLDSLLKLNQAKAFDRKTTFLNYIVLIVQRNNEILLNFKDDLPAVFKADKVFWDQCLSDLEEVESQLENVRKIALYQARQAHYRFRRRKRQEDDGDESLGDDDMNLSLEEEVEALRSTPIGMFTLSAIKYVSSLRDKVEETKAKFAHLLEYFGEEDKGLQPHELFATIVNFCRDFNKAKEEVFALEKKKQREERKRQAGRPPTHSPAPPNEKKRQPMLLKASSHQPNFSDAMRGAVQNQPEHRHTGQHLDQYHHPQSSERHSASRLVYERANSTPQGSEGSRNAYRRTNSSPEQQNTGQPAQTRHTVQEPGQVRDQYSPGAQYRAGSSPGATSAAARLKAKARIQRRTSPTPDDEKVPDAYHAAQARADHYEAQARAAAQANYAVRDYSDDYQYSARNQYTASPAPSDPAYGSSRESETNPSRSPRSSFRDKRRMQVRERIRQASSRD